MRTTIKRRPKTTRPLRREVNELLELDEDLFGQGVVDRDPRPSTFDVGEVPPDDPEMEAIWRDEGVSAGGP